MSFPRLLILGCADVVTHETEAKERVKRYKRMYSRCKCQSASQCTLNTKGELGSPDKCTKGVKTAEVNVRTNKDRGKVNRQTEGLNVRIQKVRNSQEMIKWFWVLQKRGKGKRCPVLFAASICCLYSSQPVISPKHCETWCARCCALTNPAVDLRQKQHKETVRHEDDTASYRTAGLRLG